MADNNAQRIDNLAMAVFNMGVFMETWFKVTENLPEKAVKDWQECVGMAYNTVSEKTRRLHAAEVEAERENLRNAKDSTDTPTGNRPLGNGHDQRP